MELKKKLDTGAERLEHGKGVGLLDAKLTAATGQMQPSHDLCGNQLELFDMALQKLRALLRVTGNQKMPGTIHDSLSRVGKDA